MAYHRTEMNNLFAFTSRRSIITYKLAGAESTIRHLSACNMQMTPLLISSPFATSIA